MYRVIIADAEPLSRAGICCSVPWNEFSMEIVGEAQDGYEALEKVCELGADIIIMEMKLPKMDGLQLMRELRAQQISVKVIVVSSCDAYPYVHEAMKLGACDYLLKSTATGADLREVLSTLRQQMILSEYADQADVLSIQTENAKYFRRLLLELSSEKTAERLYALFPTNAYLLCCFSPVRKQFAEVDSLFQLVLQVNREFTPVVSFQYSDYQCFSVIYHTTDKAWVESYVNAVVAAAKMHLKITCCACVSRSEKNYENFLPLYRELLSGCEHWFYLQEPKIVWCDLPTQPLFEREESATIEQFFMRIKEAISFHDLDALQQIASSVFDDLRCNPVVLPKIIKNYFINMINECVNMLRKMQFTSAEINSLFSYTDITEQADISELETWMQAFLLKYRQLIRKSREKPIFNEAIMRAIHFIDERYHEPITLTQMAASANLSINYFSALFKRVMGIGVIEYLNRYRIEQAKAWLCTHADCRVAEAADRVGFDNISYFSKTFKQQVGKTPGEYRQMQNSKMLIEDSNKMIKNASSFKIDKIIG